tara:strand:- start:466 stop:885 length:420 start_codon:yes stop_codon:yes gene_type:complete
MSQTDKDKQSKIQYYEKGVQEPWFSLIKNGKKTVEGRLNKGDFSKMKKGDIVTWVNNIKVTKNGKTKTLRKEVKTKITGVADYSSFYQMIKTERLKNTLPVPELKTIQQGVDNVYYKFYKPKDEKEKGVKAIRVQVIKK